MPRGTITVRDTLQQAQALNLADRGAEALELLLSQRNKLPQVPPRYDAAIGRLLVRSRNPAGAAEYLLGICEQLKPEIPPVLQRHLAMALLAAGRVEAAGELFAGLLDSNTERGRPGWAIRPDCKAAIEAFRNRPPDTLDSGPPTPHRVLAQAEAMAASGDTDRALKWLQNHHRHWNVVPPDYQAAISRLAHATRDREAEIARIVCELQSSPAPKRADLNAELGAALSELGRPLEAGEAFTQAILAGASDLPLWFYILADEYRERGNWPIWSFPRMQAACSRRISF
jgi:tetratricopeptide (TPR) repeat protein